MQMHASGTNRGLRSTLGLVPVLAIAVLALTSCLPLPVGDPERSRIDPRLTGIWMSGDERPMFVVLEPYDARTWLAWTIEAPGEIGEPDGLSDTDRRIPEKVLTWLESALLQEDRRTSIPMEIRVYKSWLTQLGGERFLVMEHVSRFGAENGFERDFWVVLRYRMEADGTVQAQAVNGEDSEIGDAKTRADVERIIRKRIRDPSLYGGVTRYLPVAQASYDAINGLMDGATYATDWWP